MTTDSSLYFNADTVFIDQLPAHKAGQQNHQRGQQGQVNAKGVKVNGRIRDAQQPVHHSKREHHHRKYGMTPTADQQRIRGTIIKSISPISPETVPPITPTASSQKLALAQKKSPL